MKTTPFLPSRTQMINSLPEIASILARSPYSLSACDKNRLYRFGTLVAENTENNPDDPITTLLSLTIRTARTALLGNDHVAAVLIAIYSARHGDTDKSCSEHSHQKAQLTSLVTSAKNTHMLKITKTASPLSRACH